ncbi:MAG: right-handed parallel beta-helix repeat-containing protein [Prevotella sp.]|nr:right-handed parallel beta-helix repeat-containing protein [Prevotella sp.]
MKKIAMLCLLAAVAQQMSAEEIKTAGNGKTYTLDLLSQMESDAVEKYVDEDDGEVIYTLYDNVTIAAGDKFEMEDEVTVLFDDKVTFTIEGEADFQLAKGSVFDSAFDSYDGVAPVGIVMSNEKSQTMFQNCAFYYVGLRNMSKKGLKVDNCAFYYNNGAIGQAALTIGTDGAPFEVTNSTFGYNQKAAIAGAANYRNPLLIEDCEFYCNGQANRNTPQLNLTVADNVVIRGCTIEGDPEMTMVGGIVVANMVGFTGELNTLIEDNIIKDCRFGMATYLEQKAVIRNNILKDNCHEVNPMNGGSGINVYDPYKLQYTYIEGNYIEGSLWGITLVGGKEANLGRIDVEPTSADYNPGGNVFVNNGNGGVLYDLYNNSPNTVYAQGNIWNVSQQTEEQIESVIFHKHDDSKLGTVIFMPPAPTTGITSQSLLTTPSSMLQGIHDLQGRSVQHPSKGIYIINGKKVVME